LLYFQKIEIVCYTRVDLEGTRYLLGDHSGCLLMLFLKYEKTLNEKFKVTDLYLRYFGWLNSYVNVLEYQYNKYVFQEKLVFLYHLHIWITK